MQTIKIRDCRKKNQYKIDDAYLNGYARLCGVYVTAVYNSLSRHADFETQKSFPSIELIAQQHNISRSTVIRALKTLSDWNIVVIDKEKDLRTGRQLPNLYTLVDKSEWVPKPPETTPGLSKANARVPYGHPAPGSSDDKVRVSGVDCNGTHTENGTQKTSKATALQINPLIDKFKLVNPSFKQLFVNKTQRAALERLIKEHGVEQIGKWIDLLPSVISQPFAPQIIEPLELEKKLGKLTSFIKKPKEGRPPNFYEAEKGKYAKFI